MICKQEGIVEVTREALNKIQLAKLNAVLKREKEREGFYRNLPEKLENLDALKTFPFTTESELAKNSGRCIKKVRRCRSVLGTQQKSRTDFLRLASEINYELLSICNFLGLSLFYVLH